MPSYVEIPLRCLTWGFVLIISLLAEIATTAFLSVWFVCGSIAALFAYLMGTPALVQYICFFGISALSFLSIRRKEAVCNFRCSGKQRIGHLAKEAQSRAFGLLDTQNMKPATVQIHALEALEKLADGNATKLIIPSELQNLGGILGTAYKVVKKN